MANWNVDWHVASLIVCDPPLDQRGRPSKVMHRKASWAAPPRLASLRPHAAHGPWLGLGKAVAAGGLLASAIVIAWIVRTPCEKQDSTRRVRPAAFSLSLRSEVRVVAALTLDGVTPRAALEQWLDTWAMRAESKIVCGAHAGEECLAEILARLPVHERCTHEDKTEPFSIGIESG